VVYAGLRDVSTAGPLLTGTEGLSIHPVQLDVTVPEEREGAVERILREQGRIDVLVNNAGRALGGFLEQVEPDELRDLLEVNVLAVFALTRAALPAMRAQRSGTVVMLGSVSGRMALPALGAYATSKFALEGMSEAWRHELAPFGIRVVLLEPGPFATDILSRNRAVARGARDTNSPYAAWTERMDRVFAERATATAEDPARVARRICDLAESANPAFRHPMGSSAAARILLARLAPFGVVQALVRRTLRLPDPP
jgi:NAD(P)-dependent dehydrogenase (short-subunit alcohol dehydrogenase family)